MASNDEAAAVWVSVDDLTPWEDNPRRNEAAIPEVMASIRRFGFAAPIVARHADGEVIAGHTRLEAARRLGLDRVPVRYMDLDPADAHLLALADNRVGEIASWDDAKLAGVLADLDVGEDTEGLGFDEDELRDLLGTLGEDVPVPESDEPPEVDEQGEPDSQPGVVYELGPHRLLCGDNRSDEAADLMRGADAVVTDPPYGIDASRMTMGSGESSKPRGSRLSSVGAWDAEAPPVAWLLDVAPHVCAWGGNYFRDLPTSGDWLVWHKKNDGLSFAEAELAWTNYAPNVRVLQHHWSGERKEHITQKPLEVMRWSMSYLPDEAATVVDPFGGSGTTLIACAETGRVARLIELDPRYCDVIRRRWTRWALANGKDPGPGALHDEPED